jgi:hypothetical protein
MPERTIKRRFQELDGELADDGPIFSSVAKLVKSLDRAIPVSYDLEAKKEALRLGRELGNDAASWEPGACSVPAPEPY